MTEEHVDTQVEDDCSVLSGNNDDSERELAPIEAEDNDEIEELIRLATSSDYFNMI